MVSQYLSLEDVSDRSKELVFPQSVVQYLRGEIVVPPGVFPKPLRSKVFKPCNLDPAEERNRSELGDYNFDKAAEELRSKYGSSKVSDKDVIIDWEYYKAVYSNLAHELPTTLFLNLM